MRFKYPLPEITPRVARTACLLAFVTFYVFLSACVPSPTATPPRQTPFPTLPLTDETATPELIAPPPSTDSAPGTPNAPPSASTATPLPLPTNPNESADTFPPLVQITVQDPELPVSAEQPVALNVLAADNNIVARLEVYDNNVLYAQAPALVPASVYLNQFTWKTAVLGKHTLRAVAYDSNGNASAPAQLDLNVINNNRAPAVQITAPSGNKDAEIGAPILIQGVATDDVAVTRVELLVDNQLLTFVTPERAGGVTPFAVAIPWTPQTTGAHNIVLRAYDNQNQSDDSLRYSIRVFDNEPPVVAAQSEANLVPLGDVLIVNALALANNGIARVELYVDDLLAEGINSSAPAEQTILQTALTAPDLAAGSHSFFVRAYDLTGQSTDTPRATIEVRADAPRVPRATSISSNAPTPLPPTPTATPQIVLPPPPNIELKLLNAPVVLPAAAQIQIFARGSAELDRVELWARAPGETAAQLVGEENVKGATEKTLTLNWQAPHAGVVEMYARVSDNLKQTRLSVPLRFSVQAALAPTPAPVEFNFAQAWYAESPAARFEATFVQIGRALRGSFVETRTAAGQALTGRIVSGAVNDKTILFAVDFSGAPNAAHNDSPKPHTLEFDCSFNARPPVLTCNYANENAERGSAVFQPVVP